MIRWFLERYCVSENYWSYIVGLRQLRHSPTEEVYDAMCDYLDDLWYNKLTWLEHRLVEGKMHAILQE